MTDKPLKLLAFGAHPDDCEWLTGGLALHYTQHGHKVKWVSLTNGDAGHHKLGGMPLARLRRAEAARAAEVMGGDSLVLDNHDGTLMPTFDLRLRVIQIMREFAPDVVMSHRPWDYHPDHRYTGQVVQDAINMVIVDNLVTDTPRLNYIPVMLYTWDHFQKPYPFIPDVVVESDSVLECHTSQMYHLVFGEPPSDDPAERRVWLKGKLEPYMTDATRLYRQKFIEKYGKERGEKIRYGEAYEFCEYGGRLTEEDKKRLFPW
jgi:LmbE family N-acetylglucosaminyl deacetylase